MRQYGGEKSERCANKRIGVFIFRERIAMITTAITAANAMAAIPPVDQISHAKASIALWPDSVWAR